MFDQIKKVTQDHRFEKAVSVVTSALERGNIGWTAAAFAYYILLTLFPLLLAASNIVPLFPIDSHMLLREIETIIPNEFEHLLLPIIRDYLTNPRGGTVGLSLLFSLWPASQVFGNLQTILNNIYNAKLRKNIIIARVFALLVTILTIVIFAVLTAVFVFGQQMLELFTEPFPFIDQIISIFVTLKSPVFALILFVILAFIYTVIPNVKWGVKAALPGTIFATIFFLGLGELFSLFTGFMSGSIGTGIMATFIMMMIYFYLISMIITLGGLINVLIYHYRHYDEIYGDQPIEPDRLASNEKFANYPDHVAIRSLDRIAPRTEKD